MIGQKKLLNKLNTYNKDNFPRSVMFLGERGIGKHTIVNELSNNILKLPVIDITEDISYELIEKIYLKPTPCIYLIDMSKMTEKESNIMLKLIEEPLSKSFLVLLAESKNGILNTILNRVIIFELEQYSKEELLNFLSSSEMSNKELILNVVRTPGKLKELNLAKIEDLFDLCNTIVNKINVANYLNTLTISDKINYKDEFNKFDIDLFFDVLQYCLLDAIKSSSNARLYKMYICTTENRKKLIDKRLNKELFMQNFLSQLWRVVR